MAWVSTTYAARSIGRNARRTALTIVGIGIGCALALFMESLNRGREELFARMGAFSGAGHVRVVPAGWQARRDARLRLAGWRQDADAARATAGVAAVTVRARAQVLLAMGTHVVPVEMTGVDPETEPRTYQVVRTIHEGRYLLPGEPGTVVVGRVVAARLAAGVDDEILASAVGRDGRIESRMLRIVGIVRTGNEELDGALCQVPMGEVEALTGLGGAGEVTIILEDFRAADAVRAALAGRVARGDEVLTWIEVNPEFKGHIDQDAATSRFVAGIILLVVLLGVASAQLAAVLERRREFAVLSALGMNGPAMVRLVLQEALALGLAGAVAGFAIGVPIVAAFAWHGLDLRPYMGQSYAFQGVLVEPVVYGDLGAWVVPYVLAVAIGATLAASVYPAWFAARTDPAVALRVAQ